MAQRTRAKRLARRFGLVGRGGPALACAAIVVLLAALGAYRVWGSHDGFEIVRATPELEEKDAQVGVDDAAEVASEGDVGEEKESVVIVHVDGAVNNPGVYRLGDGDLRVGDAVQSAGGLTEDADTSGINLAAHLVDGQKIHVPRAGEEPAQSGSSSGSVASGSTDAVNINAATAEELETLPGVGEATAAAIIEERERGGPFLSPEDIMRVSGIGQKKFERMRDFIVV